jgi:hypothetical protein
VTDQGDDDDMGDFWRDVRAARRQKRANNRVDSASMLFVAGIKFETKNLGAHLIVHALGLTVDFWPGTGLWIVRNTKLQGRGVQRLIDSLTPSSDMK